MRSRFATSSAALALSMSLVACVAPELDEEAPLADEIDDGKADSLSKPTDFGTLYYGAWNPGTLRPSDNVRVAAFQFEIGAKDDITLSAKSLFADGEEPFRPALYLYKRSSGTTWKLVTKRTADDSGAVSFIRALERGTYRVIVKGTTRSDAGAFVVRYTATGSANIGPECLLPATWDQQRNAYHGAFVFDGDDEWGYQDILDDEDFGDFGETSKDQLLAAAKAASAEPVRSLKAAFEIMDGGTEDGELRRYNYGSRLDSSHYRVLTFDIGGATWGAMFQEMSDAPVALIADGAVSQCTALARSCVFGKDPAKVLSMPGLALIKEMKVKAGDALDASIERQIVAAAHEWEEETTTLAQAFAQAGDAPFVVRVLGDEAGKTYVQVQYDDEGGRDYYGAFFEGDKDRVVAYFHAGEFMSCNAY